MSVIQILGGLRSPVLASRDGKDCLRELAWQGCQLVSSFHGVSKLLPLRRLASLDLSQTSCGTDPDMLSRLMLLGLELAFALHP